VRGHGRWCGGGVQCGVAATPGAQREGGDEGRGCHRRRLGALRAQRAGPKHVAGTWTDIAALVQFNESVQGPCVAQTGATCSMFACKASRGATDCVKMQCQCATGFCAQAGTCYPTSPTQCLEDTGGSCTVSACRSSRGGTYCDSGKCLCNPGNCAWKGTCFPATDTGGTCKAFGCDSSRGPSTCNQGRCLCQDGYVAVKGTCVTPT